MKMSKIPYICGFCIACFLGFNLPVYAADSPDMVVVELQQTEKIAALPLISRSVPAFASSDTAGNANDNNYRTSWHGVIPGWLAYDLSTVPEDQRSKIVVAWYSDSYDYDPTIKSRSAYGVLADYTIEGNVAPGGGTAPDSGWVALTETTNNIYHSRQHVVDFSGYNWLRINVSKVNNANGSSTSINVDVHNAQAGVEDDWIIYGDSITAGSAALNGVVGTIGQVVNTKNPNYFPIVENGGTGSILSADGAHKINGWLSTFPGKYVGLAFGTNDSWGNPGATDAYYKNMEYMVKTILAAGKVPVISKIPWSTCADVANNVPGYNAKIDALYTAYPQIIKGPDFWAAFKNKSEYLGPDGVHPSSKGYALMRQQWADVLLGIR